MSNQEKMQSSTFDGTDNLPPMLLVSDTNNNTSVVFHSEHFASLLVKFKQMEFPNEEVSRAGAEFCTNMLNHIDGNNDDLERKQCEMN